MKNLLVALMCCTMMVACGDHPNQPTAATTGMVLKVKSEQDTNRVLADAFVVVNDSLNQPVYAGFTDAAGQLKLDLPAGKYSVQLDAQGYYRLPRVGSPVLMLHIVEGRVDTLSMRMDVDSATSNLGAVLGQVVDSNGQGVAGIRVIAQNSEGRFAEVLSGRNGLFAVYNTPVGAIKLVAMGAHWQQKNELSLSLTAMQTVKDQKLVVQSVAGTKIQGSVSFLATNNGRIDITLIDPVTMLPIPGLQAFNDTGSNYSIHGVPAGDYIVWGSYLNDGYVMDPDAIRKFGLPRVKVQAGDTLLQVNFDVTGADTLLAPTNPRDTLVAKAVALDSLLFQWAKYPSAKEYFIEVRDSKGKLIWGGIDSVQSFLKSPIEARSSNCKYNFDGSATDSLRRGEVYHWKLWADRDANPGIQGLITSSEDQMGYFILK